NLNVNKSVVSGNEVGDAQDAFKQGNAADILNDIDAILNVTQTLFSNNNGSFNTNPGPNAVGFPGTIANFSGTATVNSSTFVHEHTGAIANVNLPGQSGSAFTIRNSTFTQGVGPLIYDRNRSDSGSAQVFLDYDTFVSNTASLFPAALEGA